jgi:hypothetical protein
MLEVIDRLSIKFTHTMAEMPHEYTARRKATDDADYVALYTAIMERGVIERWKGKKAPYFTLATAGGIGRCQRGDRIARAGTRRKSRATSTATGSRKPPSCGRQG